MKTKRKQTLKQRLSVMFFRLCQPHIGRVVAILVEQELAAHHRLTADVKAFILEDLERRIPRDGTTHALACHVRDHAKEIEKRLDWYDGYLVVDSKHGRA